jgi:hypothetical protein
MATGFCPALLRHIEDVADGNAPGRKMHVAGFMASLFCCQNSTVNPVNDGFDGAHVRPLTVAYRQRPTSAHVQEEDNCEVNRIPAYAEWTLPAMGFKSTSFFLADSTVQQYCVDASRERSVGQPPTRVMVEVYGLILEHANILMSEINKDLVAEMATQFGDNVTTGSATGKVINIARDGDQFILDNGIVDMMRDLQENEICGQPCIVGGGLWASYEAARAAQCCNAAGLNLSQLSMPSFFFDKSTQTYWGENTVGVLAPGSVKFIGRNAYTGSFAGQRGNSFFTTLPFPVAEFGCNLDECLRDLVFDMQLRYIDCPETIEVNGTPTLLNRGWQVILSKRYNLWVQPTDAYASGDELEGTNGTLKYFITNTSSDSGSYPYGG